MHSTPSALLPGPNTNAPTITIGEKAAELIAAAHGISPAETIGAG